MSSKKKVTVCLEHRFFKYEGQIYTKLSFPYSYWQDYLSYFDLVNIVARVKLCEKLDPDMALVTGPNINFLELPYYIGPKEFFKKTPSLLKKCLSISKSNDRFILRSGNITNLMWPFILFFRKKYLREYPGNAYEGIVGLKGNKLVYRIIGLLSHFVAKLQGKFSLANSFVSEYCKKIYKSKKPSYVFSSFNIQEIVDTKKSYKTTETIILISLGRLEKEKGHIDLIEAISLSIYRENIKLVLIGNGSQKENLEIKANDLGVRVDFKGSITNRKEIFKNLKAADIFILPSITEGMPRALLEAMAIGLPCLGSSVGGIPEILPATYLFPPSQPRKIAIKLDVLIESELLRHTNGSVCKNEVLINYSFDAQKKTKLEYWKKLYE